MPSLGMIRRISLCVGFTVGLFSSIGILAQQIKPRLSPSERVSGETLFTSNCAGCHGSDAHGGEHAPNIATASTVRRMSDTDLVQILNNGIAGSGMPAFGWIGQEKIEAIVLHLRKLQGVKSATALSGDPKQGEIIFKGKGQCSKCHKALGSGGFIGSDLSFYASDTSIDSMRAVILDPERNLSRAQKATMVTTKNGLQFEGMLRAEDNFSISLQTENGTFRYFLRSDLTKIDKESRSLMPTQYRTTLSTVELDDLISYLIEISNNKANRIPRGSGKSDNEKN